MIQISQPSVGPDELNALGAPISTGWLTQGPKVAEFERAFALMHGAESAIATSSCTTALHLILAAAGIGPGDEVIVPSFTWVATANAVLYTGARPVFADVEPETFNIDPQDAASRVTERTRAVIAVHLFGRCADIPALRELIPDDIDIFEDAACAAGAQLQGKWAGSLGRAAAFSFHPRKLITTGEGGMVTTSDSTLASKAERLRNHGAEVSEEQRHSGEQPYLLPEFNLLGFNYRMTDLQGAVGLVQLAKLNQFIEERHVWARFYRENLSDVAWLALPDEPLNGRHAWQAYVTTVSKDVDRNKVMNDLQSAGISTRPGTHAVHTLGYYRTEFNLNDDEFPGARDCQSQSMAIPLHNMMGAQDFERIVEALHDVEV